MYCIDIFPSRTYSTAILMSRKYIYETNVSTEEEETAQYPRISGAQANVDRQARDREPTKEGAGARRVIWSGA